MAEFKVASEYYNEEHGITAKIIEEKNKYWLMMIPKGQKLTYYDDPSKIEEILIMKDFKKVEKSKE